MHNNTQHYSGTVVARVIKDRAWALKRRARSQNSRQSPPAIHKCWGPHTAPIYEFEEATRDSPECFYAGKLENHA